MNTIIDVISITVIVACGVSSAVVVALWTRSVVVDRRERRERAAARLDPTRYFVPLIDPDEDEPAFTPHRADDAWSGDDMDRW